MTSISGKAPKDEIAGITSSMQGMIEVVDHLHHNISDRAYDEALRQLDELRREMVTTYTIAYALAVTLAEAAEKAFSKK